MPGYFLPGFQNAVLALGQIPFVETLHLRQCIAFPVAIESRQQKPATNRQPVHHQRHYVWFTLHRHKAYEHEGRRIQFGAGQIRDDCRRSRAFARKTCHGRIVFATHRTFRRCYLGLFNHPFIQTSGLQQIRGRKCEEYTTKGAGPRSRAFVEDAYVKISQPSIWQSLAQSSLYLTTRTSFQRCCVVCQKQIRIIGNFL